MHWTSPKSYILTTKIIYIELPPLLLWSNLLELSEVPSPQLKSSFCPKWNLTCDSHIVHHFFFFLVDRKIYLTAKQLWGSLRNSYHWFLLKNWASKLGKLKAPKGLLLDESRIKQTCREDTQLRFFPTAIVLINITWTQENHQNCHYRGDLEEGNGISFHLTLQCYK